MVHQRVLIQRSLGLVLLLMVLGCERDDDMSPVPDDSKSRDLSSALEELLVQSESRSIVESEDRFRSLIADCHRAGDCPLILARALEGLADLRRASGFLEEAEDLYVASLEVSDDPSASDSSRRRTMRSLAESLHRLGDFEESQSWFAQALDFGKAPMNGWPLDSSKTLLSFAELLKDLGKIDEAIEWARNANEIRERELDPPHEDFAECQNLLGALYLARGDAEKAELLHRGAIAMYTQLHGGEGISLAESLALIADAQTAGGHHEEAESSLHQSLKIFRLQGKDEPLFADVLSKCGANAHSQGKISEATDYFREGLDIAERVYGPRHPRVGAILTNLAVTLFAQKNLDDAILHQERAVSIQRESFGDEHPHLATASNTLGSILYAKERYEEAAKCFRESIQIRQGALPDVGHREVIKAQRNLAKCLVALEKPKESIELLRESLRIGKLPLGVDDPLMRTLVDELASMLNDDVETAALFCEFGRAVDGEELALRCLRNLDDDPANGMRAKRRLDTILGQCLTLQEKFEEAERVLVESYLEWDNTEANEAKSGSPKQVRIDAIIELYTAWGRLDDVDEWRLEYDD